MVQTRKKWYEPSSWFTATYLAGCGWFKTLQNQHFRVTVSGLHHRKKWFGPPIKWFRPGRGGKLVCSKLSKTSPIWFRPLLLVQTTKTKTWSITSFPRLLRRRHNKRSGPHACRGVRVMRCHRVGGAHESAVVAVLFSSSCCLILSPAAALSVPRPVCCCLPSTTQAQLSRRRLRPLLPPALSSTNLPEAALVRSGTTILVAARVISSRSCGELCSSSKTGCETHAS